MAKLQQTYILQILSSSVFFRQPVSGHY
uniref:Uncharacterized protein n=1 Tax=Rhizophora mucronata TaxID=61149 RepID=A0A2P2LSA8_RHIMU